MHAFEAKRWEVYKRLFAASVFISSQSVPPCPQVPVKLGFEFDAIGNCVTGLHSTQRGSSAVQQDQGDEGSEGAIANVTSPLLTRLLHQIASVEVQKTCRVSVKRQGWNGNAT